MHLLRINRVIKAVVSAAVAAMAGGLSAAPAHAQETSQALTGARIIPIVGEPIEKGTLVIQDGKVVAVGPAGEVEVPEGAELIDVTGKTIMPGLVDTHSHIGGTGGADGSGPIQPDVRVFDSLNVRDSGFRRATAGGLTTLNIMPGSGHLMSGQTLYAKLRKDPKTIEDFFFRREDGSVMGGMKMANGTNPIGEPPFPGTRGKSAALVRQHFINAREYQAKMQKEGNDPTTRPGRDIGMDAMVEVLEGKRVVHHHTHRADDIMTVLRLQEEFGFKVVLQHVSEAWKVADEIAEAGVPCSIILVDAPGGKLEAVELLMKNAPVLEKAGVETAFHTDDYITDSRLFLRMAAMGVRAGMSEKAALEALTIKGARMLDLADRIGSLEAGKDADFIILSGEPLSVYTDVEQTWVEGQKVFDRSVEKDRLYATGGYGAGHDTDPYLCCFDHLE